MCIRDRPYVDCLCNEVEEIRRQADKAGLTLCRSWSAERLVGVPPPM